MGIYAAETGSLVPRFPNWQWRAVRFVAGEALTLSESDLQIYKPNTVA